MTKNLYAISVILYFFVLSLPAAADSLPNRQRRLALVELRGLNTEITAKLDELEAAGFLPSEQVSFRNLTLPYPRNYFYDREANLLVFHSGYLSADYRYLAWVFAIGLHELWLEQQWQKLSNTAFPHLIETESANFYFGLCAWQLMGAPNQADYSRDPRFSEEALLREMSTTVWIERWRSYRNDFPAFSSLVQARYLALYEVELANTENYLINHPESQSAINWLHQYIDSLQAMDCTL